MHDIYPDDFTNSVFLFIKRHLKCSLTLAYFNCSFAWQQKNRHTTETTVSVYGNDALISKKITIILCSILCMVLNTIKYAKRVFYWQHNFTGVEGNSIRKMNSILSSAFTFFRVSSFSLKLTMFCYPMFSNKTYVLLLK